MAVQQGKTHNKYDQEKSKRDEYMTALRKWLDQAHAYHYYSTCMPYLATSRSAVNYSHATRVINNFERQTPYYQRFPNNQPINNQENNNNNQLNRNASPAEVIAQYGGFQYVIPPLWKRFIAEFIDFLILFILKLAVTYIAVDFFDYIDMEKYDLEEITKNIQEDYQLALEMTSEILVLELIYRVLVCIFEAICLSVGFGGRLSGATPGKVIMGLRVVTATAVLPVPGNQAKDVVLIYPARRLNFATSLMRSVMKNILLSMLFPLCFVLFFFPHNRTLYDLTCKVVVVEENMYPPVQLPVA